MTNTLSAIKEFQYVTGTYPELDMLLCKGNIEHWYVFNYTYAVLLDLHDSKEVIRCSQSTTRYIMPKQNFVDYLEKLQILNLPDLTYLCSSYRRPGTEDKLFEWHKGRIPFVNEYLKQTYGKLLYKSQAIYLFSFYAQLSNEDSEKAVGWLNDHTLHGIAWARDINVDNNYSFLNLWYEYTFDGRVREPKYDVAKKLYDFLT
ncbi:MAG TPA: hypothetical protein VHD35_12915 [Chitinophagaceae bacterium]|nr:hypothetical protein [Chitinophagaceae bacterium]